MKVELHDDKTFASAAAMRAHYAAVRARLHPLAPRVPKTKPARWLVPGPAPEPERPIGKPRIPLSILEQRRDQAEERRRDLIAQAQFDINDGAAIVKYAAAYFDVSVEQVLEKGKQGGPALDARHVAAYVMLEWYGRGRKNHKNRHSLKWIGDRINRDHTIVLYADDRVRRNAHLLKAGYVIFHQINERGGPYVAFEAYKPVEPEAYKKKRNAISACRF